MAARLLRGGHHEPSGIARRTTSAFARLEARYARTLDRVLARQHAILLLTAASLVAAVAGFALVPKGFFPAEDTGKLFISTEASPDVSFATMVAHQRRVAAIVARDPAVDHVVSIMGTSGTANAGRVFSPLKPRGDRDSADAVLGRLPRALGTVPGMSAYPNMVQNLQLGGRPGASLYQYTLAGADGPGVRAYARRLETELRAAPAFQDVTTDDQRGARALEVALDVDAASRLGVPSSAVRHALYAAFGAHQISNIYTESDSYQVILEADKADQQDPSGLPDLFVRTSTGGLVPLAAVTRTTIAPASLSVSHTAQLPSVTVAFNLRPGVALSKAETLMDDANARLGMPEGVAGSVGGNAQAFEAPADGQGLLFAGAIAAIYLVLGVLYESFTHPLTILSGLPAAGLGALGALALLGMPLDVIGVIGVVLLIGIAKKNAIMKVDVAITARRDGFDAEAAIRRAAVQRFRSIAMTSLAALAGALPIALGLGAGAELRQPPGVAAAGGLLASQPLTLFITPSIYLAVERASAWVAAKRSRLAAA